MEKDNVLVLQIIPLFISNLCNLVHSIVDKIAILNELSLSFIEKKYSESSAVDHMQRRKP